jgi:hypothetical protein
MRISTEMDMGALNLTVPPHPSQSISCASWDTNPPHTTIATHNSKKQKLLHLKIKWTEILIELQTLDDIRALLQLDMTFGGE